MLREKKKKKKKIHVHVTNLYQKCLNHLVFVSFQLAFSDV
jgi:hypothetical protein